MEKEDYVVGKTERGSAGFDPKFFEQPISKENRENINIALAEVNAVLKEYGYAPQVVGFDDLLMLSPEGFESMNGEDKLGALDVESGKIFINAKAADSKLRLALKVTHELFHRGTYPFDQKDPAKIIIAPSWLNEAIVSLLERKVFLRLKELDFYRDEIDEMRQIDEKYAESVENEMNKSGYDKDDVFLIRKHGLPGVGGPFTLELRHFPYLEEYRMLQTLLKKIIERGGVERDVEALFIKTIPCGDTEPLKKRLEDVFGGSFFEKLRSTSSAREFGKIIEAL